MAEEQLPQFLLRAFLKDKQFPPKRPCLMQSVITEERYNYRAL